MMRWKSAPSRIAFAAAFFTMVVSASTVLSVDFEQLSRTAHHVVAGEVTQITPSRDEETGYIYSQVTILVSHASPAELVGRSYSFRMIGGEMEGKSVYIADFPRFQVEDTIAFFLTSNPSTVFGPTVGLWQGLFFVDKDASGSETVTDHLRRPIVGVREQELIRAARKTGSSSDDRSGEGSDSQGMNLDDFFRQVESFRSPYAR
jgi:hypothetical protein